MRLDARVAKLVWRGLALVFVALGVVGVFLPLLPTVPFLIAAAWAGGRGWPALEHWLLEHPRYGKHIRQWRRGGAVPRRAKWAASGMMVFSAAVVLLADVPIVFKITAPLVMGAIALWLWMRPEP
ncbi:YbaN family protein [Variovorax sp. J22R115]|uniref:YbaN family protein n=1 Tax=Variovorax sp. J22R115 TaxID=3053509 RepID=UPI002578DEAE|nr:YbaN family protein [Variovorax sp. J22R115]MDM0047897.1 YbaN family protein [Variovorax sp. J22R115]